MKIESLVQPEVVKEIERKFKVKKLPDNLESFPKNFIKQGYISISDDGGEVRVRQKDNKYFKTEKSGIGVVRNEFEEEISKEDFDNLWLKTDNRVVEKTRYEIDLADGNLAELDIYHGKLDGLVVVEVEFIDSNKANEFLAPDWFGDDVTDNSQYKNASLAICGNPEVVESQKILELQEGLDYLIKEIQSRAAEKQEPLIILIAGGSASGKTSAVANSLHEAFDSESVLFSIDDYYFDHNFKDKMASQGFDYNYDQPEMIDFNLFSDHLSKLKNNQKIKKPIYNFSISETDSFEEIEPKKIIIVEGMFALNKKIIEQGDIKVFVTTDSHGRLIRRILRDIESRGRTPDGVLDYFAKIVQPMHMEHVENTRKDADLVIKNEYNPEKEARGNNEVQLKFKFNLSNEDLQKLGAELLTTNYQVDTYYNPKDKDLFQTGEVLRIREENGHNIITYKGPKKEGTFRIRPKIEFEINSAVREKFIRMYGDAVVVIKKDRTLYQLNGVTFSVDNISKISNSEQVDLGSFLEIRGNGSSDSSDLEAVIKILGLDIAHGDKRPYSEM